MPDPAEKFSNQAPGIHQLRSIEEGAFIHEYRGWLADVESEIRFLTLAPGITDDAIDEAFTQVAGQWQNPSTHPNIVTVHDRGDTPRPWIATDIPAGDPLDAVQAKLSLPEIRTVIEDTSEALRNAHLYNTTHLDLQPANIYIDSATAGDLKVRVDKWGLERACRVAAGQDTVAPHTAPELLGDPTGGKEQTDVYGLGVVAYYALTGQPPITSDSDIETAIRTGYISPPRTVDPTVPPAVDDMILTALATSPADRYDSSYAFQTAITNALPEQTPTKSDTPPQSDSDTEKDSATDTEVDAEQSSEDEETTSDDDAIFLTRRTVLPLLGFGTLGVGGSVIEIGGPNNEHVPLHNSVEYAFSDRVQWAFQTGDTMGSLPAVVDDTVYIGSGDNIVALSAEDGTQQWRVQTNGDVSSPTVVDDTIYVGSDDNSVYALDAADGTEQWAFQTEDWVNSSPAVVDDTVYIGSDDNTVYALDATDGTEQWTFQTRDEVNSSPAVVDDTVYIGSYDNTVYALDAADGTEQWAFQTDDDVLSSPAVVDATVYIGSDDSTVYALDATDGTEQWTFQTGDDVLSSPAVVDETVYVGSINQNVYALDATDGTEQWTFQAEDWVTSSPAVVDDTVYIGNWHKVQALDAKDGTHDWAFQTGGWVSSPMMVDGTVYVRSGDGSVYALDAGDVAGEWPMFQFDQRNSGSPDNAGSSSSSGSDQGSSSVPEPSVSLSVTPEVATVNEEITLTAEATVAQEASVEEYEWAVGEDAEFKSGEATRTVSFGDPGEYLVRVLVTDSTGQTAFASTRIPIKERPTAEVAVQPTSPRVNQTVTFSATNVSVADSRSLTNYEWAIGTDASFSDTGPEITHTFTETGEYPVRLRVTDSAGVTTTTTVTVSVVEATLTATFETYNGQISVDDGVIDVTGIAPDQDVIVVAFIDRRGNTTAVEVSVDDDDTFEMTELDIGNLARGTVTGHVISMGSDHTVGDGSKLSDASTEAGTTLDLVRYINNEIDGNGNGDMVRSRLQSNTVDASGSDDLIETVAFRLSRSLTQISNVYPEGAVDADTVESGETMVIEGTTNRRPGDNVIVIELLTQDDDSVELTSTDSWDTSGEWSATINTEDVEPGTYVVNADDGDSADRVEVEIVVERS